MTFHRRFLVVLLTVLVMELSSRAFAGTLTLNDKAHLFAEDPAALRVTVGQMPFDVRVLVDRNNPHILDDAKAWVAENTITIAVDPQLRVTYTRFGYGVGVPPHAFDPVALAGNPQFRDQRWAEGIEAIVQQTQKARTQTVTAPQPAEVTLVEPSHTIISGWWVVMGIGGCTVAVLLALGFWWTWWSKRREREAHAAWVKADQAHKQLLDEAAEAISRNTKDAQYYLELDKAIARNSSLSDQPTLKKVAPLEPDHKPVAGTTMPVEASSKPALMSPIPDPPKSPSALSTERRTIEWAGRTASGGASKAAPAPAPQKPTPASMPKAAPAPAPAPTPAPVPVPVPIHTHNHSHSSSSYDHSSSSSGGGGGGYSSSSYSDSGGGGGSFGDSGGGGGSF